jgi:hypothetical protein
MLRLPVEVAVGVVVVGTVLVGAAGPAAADAPVASDYESAITGVEPGTDAVEVEVTGAGSFLRLTAEPGHEVVVLGYADEPYLRFRDDGTVEANQESPATYVNESRTGTADVPEGVDAEDPPRWKRVADGGSHAWHDHRIHWMGSQPPAGVDRGGEVRRWTVPLRVDGEPVRVEGVLTYAEATPWWPWLLLVVAAGTAAWWLVRRRTTIATVAAGVAAATATALAAAEQLAIPAEAGRQPIPVAVPAIGLVLAVAALVLRGNQRNGRNLALAATAAAIGWALLRLDVFAKPVLVTDLAPTADRAGTAAVLALALGAAGALVSPPPRPTSSGTRPASRGPGGPTRR